MRWLLLLWLFNPFPVMAQDDWSGPAQVMDGDTIRIDGTRLRLLDIDAFESAQTCTRGGQEYACGIEATRALSGLIAGRVVNCHGRQRDRYARPLVNCWVGDLDLNADMVRSGWAVAEFSTMYNVDEALAREARVGAWAGSFMRPKDWRKANPR